MNKVLEFMAMGSPGNSNLVTKAHLIVNTDPDILQIKFCEIEDDGGMYANKSSCF